MFLSIRKLILSLLSLLILLLLIVLIVLRIWSPGKANPFQDSQGKPLANSISEKVRVEINGVQQGMFIKGKNTENPVLLYIHGGMPDYFLTQDFPTGLENEFVVVWWEQRGAGMSYDAKNSDEKISTEKLVADVLAVTNYLRERFGREKIYVMGHSGGTFIGIKAVAKAPQLYHVYIGVAQASNQLKSEKLAYDYMVKTFRETGNKKMLNKLEAAPVTDSAIPDEYLRIRDEAMHKLGIGTMHNMRSVAHDIFLRSWRFKEYSLSEKLNLWRAKANSGVSVVWTDMISTDLNQSLPEVSIPVYFLEGIFDYTCSYSEAKLYFTNLKAPIKGFYTFNNSAHSPIFEEPEKVRRILREDVLTGNNTLADY